MLTDWTPLLSYRALPAVAGIYVIRNTVNGKEYVGKSKNVRKRLCGHCSSTKKHPLQLALQKHGLAAFEVALLAIGAEADLSALEVAAIAERGTYGAAGYNASRGGEGVVGLQWTDEWREAQSARVKGVPLTSETKEKMRKSALANNPFKGRTHSAETKAKIGAAASLRQKGKKLSPEHVANMSAALKGRKPPFLSAEVRARISLANRKPNPNKGVKGEDNFMFGKRGSQVPTSKPVAVWCAGAMVPRIFDSAADTARAYGTTLGSVADWCRGRYKPKNGYVFCYI